MALDASVRLSWLINALQAAQCQIVIIAHSLGARVSLRALLDLTNRIQHLVLLAPAVSNQALCADGGEFPRSRVAAENITICWSSRDNVLNSAVYGLGEKMYDAIYS